MVSFYKHDIPAWMDGTENLSDGAYRVYHVVCQLIYLNEGPIALNERGIAGRCNQSLRGFRKHLNELVEAGKLSLENGKLDNERTVFELENVRTNRENAGKGGKISRKGNNPTDNHLKNKEPSQAPLNGSESLKEKRREEKRREEVTDVTSRANKRGSRLPDDWSPSAQDMRFAKSKGLTDDEANNEAEKFRNYWLSKPGQGGVKLDWTKTWQNWCITAAERKPTAQPRASPPTRQSAWQDAIATTRKDLDDGH